MPTPEIDAELAVRAAWYTELLSPVLPEYARRADVRHGTPIGPAPHGWYRLHPITCSRVLPHNEYYDHLPEEAGRNAEMNETHLLASEHWDLADVKYPYTDNDAELRR